jgi:nanoRNase/pAp phosphatase (c-di-AMP/oligoRNAs hydrolase)
MSHTKHSLKSIACRNRIIDSILTLIDEKDNFLIVGHLNPDEDCISSQIAMALLIRDLRKNVFLIIPRTLNSKYQYMINMAKFNSIQILYNDEKLPCKMSTLFVLDTPKPSMRQPFLGDNELLSDPNVPIVEIDHHLEADSGYIGDPELRLVDEAASASELVGIIGFKLNKRKVFKGKDAIADIFSRNFVLSVLTGLVGDTKMGQFLKTPKERRFYELFSNIFNQMLTQKTRRDSSNFSSMKEIFSVMQNLSDREDNCFQAMSRYRVPSAPQIGTIIIPPEEMLPIAQEFDHETIVTVARYLADSLAEKSGYLSFIAYADIQEESSLIQFRIRRNQAFQSLDLRDLLEHFKIENGGGHPGAVGFRIPVEELGDLKTFTDTFLQELERLLPGE